MTIKRTVLPGEDRSRRHFCRTAALAVASARFATSAPASAQSAPAKPEKRPLVKPAPNTAFTTLKQIDAAVRP